MTSRRSDKFSARAWIYCEVLFKALILLVNLLITHFNLSFCGVASLVPRPAWFQPFALIPRASFCSLPSGEHFRQSLSYPKVLFKGLTLLVNILYIFLSYV